MNATVAAEEIGTASAIKMCRSIMIKGIEALVVESMFAARRFGAEDAVLASLDKTFPHMGWNAELPDYLVSRVADTDAAAPPKCAKLRSRWKRSASRRSWRLRRPSGTMRSSADGRRGIAYPARGEVFLARACRCARRAAGSRRHVRAGPGRGEQEVLRESTDEEKRGSRACCRAWRSRPACAPRAIRRSRSA